MKNLNFRFFINNIIRCSISLVICNIFGYLMYMMFLNTKNYLIPEKAPTSTGLFSLIFFSLFVILAIKIAEYEPQNSTAIDERIMLENAFKDSNYTLDYNGYFKKQIKTRLCGYYLIAFLSQIPLVVNYILIHNAGEKLYNSPLNIYKFNMVSIFGYELTGKAWWLGPIIFTVLFSVIFTFYIYKSQKKLLIKPSYIK